MAGLVGVLYSVPLFLLLRNPPQAAPAAAGVSPFAAIRTLAGNRDFLLLVLSFTLPAIAGWVVRDWMPDILKEQFGLGQGAAGGWLADRWMQRTSRGRIFTSALGMACFLPALVGVGNAQSLAMAVGFLVLFGLGWGFFDCNNMPILCQVVRPELRATAYGVMNLARRSCRFPVRRWSVPLSPQIA